jgi:hypothetical protein
MDVEFNLVFDFTPNIPSVAPKIDFCPTIRSESAAVICTRKGDVKRLICLIETGKHPCDGCGV